jgi:hypothetical protein
LEVLEKLENYYDDFLSTEVPPSDGKRKKHHAIVISDILEKYYTCLETIFFRISAFFENNLGQEKWHQDLLERMLLRIEGVRERVLKDETYAILLEFLKFRHFKRYYFQLDYDWDKLDYLSKKFMQVRGMVREDLASFLSFLTALSDSAE